MNYIREFAIILIITFLGELARAFIPLPIPASIYGLVIMLVCLSTKIVKLDSVKRAGMFMIEIMPMMFIPAAVAIIASWDILQPIWGKVLIVMAVSTVVVMAVSGWVTQLVIKLSKKSRR